MFVKSQKALIVGHEHGNNRVILMQQEIMIKVLINVALDAISNVGEVADHTLFVKLFLLYGNRGLNAVSMQVSAFAGMIH
jgi:hypothetical protein